MEKRQIQTAPIQSGQAGGTIAWSDVGDTTLGNYRERFSLTGGDPSLFTVELGPNVPSTATETGRMREENANPAGHVEGYA